jgi:nitrous oxidase accessory protein
MKKFLIFFGLYMVVFASTSLQQIIDQAKPGSKIELPDGIFNGNIVIEKPLIIIGQGKKTIIQGDAKDTVIKIRNSNVAIKNLTIRHSGSEHERVDAGVSIKDAKFCEISNCFIQDCLFGIDLQNVHRSKLINNFITSKKLPLGIRGDGVRLWYSNDNILRKNHLYKSRDFVIWYSHGNLIEENIGEFGRYSLHFMYTGKNIVKKNVYKIQTDFMDLKGKDIPDRILCITKSVLSLN